MPPKIRYILCAAFLAYLVGDLFLFHGPLDRAIQTLDPDSPQSIAKARKNGIIARVHQQPITSSQLDRAVFERLWLEGKSEAAFSTSDRQAALDELIEHEFLRYQIAQENPEIQVSDSEINTRLTRLLGRFETKSHLESAMKSQGIPTEKVLRERIAARIREQKFIESKIAPFTAVTEAEAKIWFDENHKSLEISERIEARHIFIATLRTPSDEAKQKLEAALAQLTGGQKDFATLARELSDDPATKDQGGNLGWMSRNRLAPDFTTPVFALPLAQPTLIRTKLGWHLIEVTARKPAEPRTFEATKAEIFAALEATKRRDAVRKYRENLRRSSGVRIF